MADELYQEFFLALCETTDNRLIEAHAGGWLEVLCVGIINNIWGKRGRVKTYVNGQTSPLYELGNWTTHIKYEERDWQGEDKYPNEVVESHIPGGEEFDFDKAMRQEKARTQIKEMIEQAKESNNKDERFRARVFEYSTFTYKDPRKFSKASNIPYFVCWKATSDFKKQIIQRINDLHIDSGL